jgi:hypothetical protein
MNDAAEVREVFGDCRLERLTRVRGITRNRESAELVIWPERQKTVSVVAESIQAEHGQAALD